MTDPKVKPFSVIIADGEFVIRSALAEYLRYCGYTVILASSSDEVIAIMQDSATEVSVILSDARLDGIVNAFELRIWVKERHPEVQIILAGNVEKAARAAGVLCDEGPYLSRPYDPQIVVVRIKGLLAGSQTRDRNNTTV